MKQLLFNHLKNIPGWRTSRKLVVIVVDDYGNVRLNNKKARENLDKEGFKSRSRFDEYDTLETREDLEALYEVLQSVRDKNGNHAVFTPYALSCNPDFESMADHGYQEYIPEQLPVTYEKLSAEDPTKYQDTWSLWQEGISSGIMAPQYHGREHLNLKIFNDLLKREDPVLVSSLRQRSVVGLDDSKYSNMGWTAAFSFEDESDLDSLNEILKDGLSAFEQVYGYKPDCFTPPAQQFPPAMEGQLAGLGIKCLDRPFYTSRHLGSGIYKRQISVMKKLDNGFCHLVRNVVFEPTDSSIDHVAKAMDQIAAAFFWNKPAIISSHRVNFCGYIDPANRKKGLRDLKGLLDAIVKRWPDVEFVSASDLGKLILDNAEN